MNNKQIKADLIELGLSPYEATIFTVLSKTDGMTHLELSRETGINRSKVYRLVEELAKRSLVHIGTDEKKRIFAADPNVLKVGVVNVENELERMKTALESTLPALQELNKLKSNPLNFKINTYEGVEGFKQMLWNELKTKGENLVFGSGTLEDLVDSHAWAERHREKTKDVNYTIREVKSLSDTAKKKKFTDVEGFDESFSVRYLDDSLFDFRHQIAIYNDTVAIYCYRDGQKVGVEVVNENYAKFYRSTFEMYWDIAN